MSKKEESLTQRNIEEFKLFRSLLSKNAESNSADKMNNPYYKKMIWYLFDLRNRHTGAPSLSWLIKIFLEESCECPDATALRSWLIWVRYVHAIATFHYLYAEVKHVPGIFGEKYSSLNTHDTHLRQLFTRKNCLNVSDIEKLLDNCERDITELVKITENLRARVRWLQQAGIEKKYIEDHELVIGADDICVFVTKVLCPPPAIVLLGVGIACVCLGASPGFFIAAFVLSALFFAILAIAICYSNSPHMQIEQAQMQNVDDRDRLCEIASKIRKNMNDSLSLIKFSSDFKVSESPQGFLRSETNVARKTSILDRAIIPALANMPVFNK